MAVNLGGGNVVEHGDPISVANEGSKNTIELKILGQETHPAADRPIFEHELCDQERVVAEEDVYLRIKQYSFKYLCFLCICFPLGILWLCTRFLGCGHKKIFQQRARLTITSLGRVFVYKTKTDGSQQTRFLCIDGNRKFNSSTVLTTFSLHDLSHVRLEYIEYGAFLNLDCCCFKAKAATLMQLCFGKYPEHMNRLCSGLTDHVMMAPLVSGREEQTKQVLKGETRMMFFGIKRMVLNAALFASGETCERVIELWSHKEDLVDLDNARGQDSDQAKYDRMFALQQKFLRFMNYGEGPRNYIMPSQTKNQPPKNFVHIQPNENKNIVDLDKGIVHVCRKRLGLLDNCGRNGKEKEVVLEAFPIYHSMRWYEWILCCIPPFFPIILFCLYWFACGKKRHSMRGAVLITQKRLIEVGVVLPNILSKEKTFPDDASEDMEFKLAWWPLDMDQEQVGYLEVKRDQIWAHCKTRFGGLYMHSDFKASGNKKEMFERMRQFLTYLSRTFVHKVFEPPEKGFANQPGREIIDKSWLLKNWAPADNEHIIHHMFSEDVEPAGCEALPCCKPDYAVQEIIITTHRVWAAARAESDPMCCPSEIKQAIMFWMPLRNLQRFQVTGGVHVNESCCQRIFNCHSMLSTTRIEIGALDGFPIVLHRRIKSERGGQLNDSDIVMIRQILGRAMAANHNYIASVKFYPLPTWPQVTANMAINHADNVKALCDVSNGAAAVTTPTNKQTTV